MPPEPHTTGTWRTGRPESHGYYLAAWRRGGEWRVSELWFNPESHGHWWRTRGYLGERSAGEPIEVVAWQPMPVYEPVPASGG